MSWRVAWLCVGCSLLVCVARGADLDLHERAPIVLPAEDLGKALQALAMERRFQIAYVTGDVAGLRVDAIAGSLTTEEVLVRLLQGTSLTFRRAGNGIGIVRKATGR